MAKTDTAEATETEATVKDRKYLKGKVTPVHEGHAAYIKEQFGVEVPPEFIFAVYSTRVAYRKTSDQYEEAKAARIAAKEAEVAAKEEAKAAKAKEREAKKAAKDAEKKEKAEKAAAEKAAEAEKAGEPEKPAKGGKATTAKSGGKATAKKKPF